MNCVSDHAISYIHRGPAEALVNCRVRLYQEDGQRAVVLVEALGGRALAWTVLGPAIAAVWRLPIRDTLWVEHLPEVRDRLGLPVRERWYRVTLCPASPDGRWRAWFRQADRAEVEELVGHRLDDPAASE